MTCFQKTGLYKYYKLDSFQCSHTHIWNTILKKGIILYHADVTYQSGVSLLNRSGSRAEVFRRGHFAFKLPVCLQWECAVSSVWCSVTYAKAICIALDAQIAKMDHPQPAHAQSPPQLQCNGIMQCTYPSSRSTCFTWNRDQYKYKFRFK